MKLTHTAALAIISAACAAPCGKIDSTGLELNKILAYESGEYAVELVNLNKKKPDHKSVDVNREALLQAIKLHQIPIANGYLLVKINDEGLEDLIAESAFMKRDDSTDNEKRGLGGDGYGGPAVGGNGKGGNNYGGAWNHAGAGTGGNAKGGAGKGGSGGGGWFGVGGDGYGGYAVGGNGQGGSNIGGFGNTAGSGTGGNAVGGSGTGGNAKREDSVPDLEMVVRSDDSDIPLLARDVIAEGAGNANSGSLFSVCAVAIGILLLWVL